MKDLNDHHSALVEAITGYYDGFRSNVVSAVKDYHMLVSNELKSLSDTIDLDKATIADLTNQVAALRLGREDQANKSRPELSEDITYDGECVSIFPDKHANTIIQWSVFGRVMNQIMRKDPEWEKCNLDQLVELGYEPGKNKLHDLRGNVAPVRIKKHKVGDDWYVRHVVLTERKAGNFDLDKYYLGLGGI